MAGIKLQSLKMTATADEYIAAFQVLADRTGYNEAALIDFFQCGLTTPLAKSIYTCSGGPPTDLQGWKDTASTRDHFECAWAQDNHEVKQNRAKNSPHAPHTPLAPLQQSLALTPLYLPMDLDVSQHTCHPIICYTCNKPGHKLNACPNKSHIRATEFAEALKEVLPMMLAEGKKIQECFPSSQQ
jgi:hypothetical protein